MSREEAELDRLVRLARQADLPDAARLARVRARFLPPTAAPAPTPTGAGATGKGILGAKIVVGLAAVGLGVWSYVDLMRPTPEVPIVVPAPQSTEPPPPSAPPPPEPQPTSAGAQAEPAPLEAPVETTIKPRAKKPRAEPVTAVPASTLAQEAALLQLVAVQLRAGQVERARDTLAEFTRRYPESALNADRERLERRLAQSQPAP
ncbi:MAG TPA: tetratricopeptide repeat protein [Polyangiales bacterium]|nr:tetratricopeptide repeat protein [Polyangiales bacterium]